MNMSKCIESEEDWRQDGPIGKVMCSSSRCDLDLHCFRRKRPRSQSYRNGTCVSCNVDLIDWERLDKRNLKDSKYTISALKRELVRHYYWCHVDIDEQAINHAQKLGLEGLRDWAINRLTNYVAAPSKELFRDGTQTPLRGRVVYYAQHATASCCRKCMEEWYGINRNRPLTKKQITYFTELIILYIRDMLPDLPASTEKSRTAIPVARQR